MANILRVSRLVNGIQRQVDLSTNSVVMLSLKLSTDGGTSSSELTKAILDKLITMQGVADVDGSYDTRYHLKTDLASVTNAKGAALIGIEDAVSQFTATTVEGALTESIDAAQAAQASIDDHKDGGASKHDATEVDYERGDGSKKNIQAASDAVEAALTDLDDAIGAMVQGASYTAGSVGIAASHFAAIDAALTALNSTVSNFEWANSALSYIVDNTLVPATEVSGNRYVLSHDGGAPHANWDGASAGDTVEFDGATWVATTPTTGMFISVDDDTTGLYQWGGSSWAFKAFEATTASGGLEKTGFDIALAAGVAGAGIALAAGVLSIDFSEFDSDSITEGSSNLFMTTTERSKLGGIENNAKDDQTAAEVTYDNATSGLSASDVKAALDELAAGAADTESLSEDLVAGETLPAGLKALRFARAAETAGRAYLADKDATTNDNFYVAGLVVAAGEVAAAAINNVVKAGKITATAHGFTIGAPIYLGSSGVLTNTPPDEAVDFDDASVKVGIARDANTIEVQIQFYGIV